MYHPLHPQVVSAGAKFCCDGGNVRNKWWHLGPAHCKRSGTVGMVRADFGQLAKISG